MSSRLFENLSGSIIVYLISDFLGEAGVDRVFIDNQDIIIDIVEGGIEAIGGLTRKSHRSNNTSHINTITSIKVCHQQ